MQDFMQPCIKSAGKKDLCHAVHGTRAEDHDGVARLNGCADQLCGVVVGGDVGGVLDCGGELLGGNAVDIIFSCGVNIEEIREIRVTEGGGEFVEEGSGSRIGVGLEEGDESAFCHCSCGLQRCLQLLGVVRVVDIDLCAVHTALVFEAAAQSLEGGERFADLRRRESEHIADDGGGKGAENMMVADDDETDMSEEIFSFINII